MPITPEERRQAFQEVVNKLSDIGNPGSFSKLCIQFDKVFRDVCSSRRLEYSSEAGSGDRGIFFFPFYDDSSFWRHSIEIVESTSQYTVFDRHGRFAIFRKNRDYFGRLIVSNSPEHPIAKLEGRSANSLLSNVFEMMQTITNLQNEVMELKNQNERLVLNNEEKESHRIGVKHLQTDTIMKKFMIFLKNYTYK